jgi:hypothetical protein
VFLYEVGIRFVFAEIFLFSAETIDKLEEAVVDSVLDYDKFCLFSTASSKAQRIYLPSAKES